MKNTLLNLVSGSTNGTSNLDKANLLKFLNDTFVNNFNYTIPGLTAHLPDASPDGCPIDFLCTDDEVYGLLSTLDTTKANGHDNISAMQNAQGNCQEYHPCCEEIV